MHDLNCVQISVVIKLCMLLSVHKCLEVIYAVSFSGNFLLIPRYKCLVFCGNCDLELQNKQFLLMLFCRCLLCCTA